MSQDASLRDHVAKLLDWEDGHVGFEAAVADIEPRHRGSAPKGIPHTPWQILEHLRRTQRDILEFCVAPKYEEKKWPEEYWPSTSGPGSGDAWKESVDAFRKDRTDLVKLARDTSIDLFARVPNGTGQTYLRELLLVADHNAYHIGQLILVRRALGIWG